MRYLGRLHEWNDDKGFGFVTPNGGGTRAFVHIKAFERATRRPVLGDLLSYELTSDSKGRSNAAQVRFAA
jgi:cold shock CspA family protein